MINYFKYVDSGSFTSTDNSNYSGMVNVLGSNVYTGSIFTKTSTKLSATNTFLPQVILNKIDIGPTYKLNVPIDRANILQRDILNYDTIKVIADTVNMNNLKIYSNQITYNPNIFNSLVKTSDRISFTQCITSVGDIFNGKRLPKFRVSADQTDFYKVRTTVTDNNSLFVSTSGDNYYYFNNGNMCIGNSNTSETPIFRSGMVATNFDHKYIQYNPYTSTLYYTTIDTCSVYNFNFSRGGAVLSLSDKFDISAIRSLTDRRNSVYGANYRSAIVTEQGVSVLEISFNLSQDLLKVFTADDLGFDTINRIIQRFEDDILVVIGNIDGKLHLKVFDIPNMLNSISAIYSNELIGCNQADVFELSTFDSNIIIVRRFKQDSTLDSLEFRSISNSTYPIFKITSNSLLGLIRVNQIINQLTENIDDSDITLLPESANSNNNIIYDIQFSVGNSLNAIILFSDSFTVVSSDMFLNLLPKNLLKSYTTVQVGGNSVGLNINNIVKNLISDTVNLYYNSTKKYNFNANGVISNTYPYQLDDITTDNLYLYENEYLNVGVLNRMFNELFNIQQKLAININTSA